jgi:hypothetical protein
VTNAEPPDLEAKHSSESCPGSPSKRQRLTREHPSHDVIAAMTAVRAASRLILPA